MLGTLFYTFVIDVFLSFSHFTTWLGLKQKTRVRGTYVNFAVILSDHKHKSNTLLQLTWKSIWDAFWACSHVHQHRMMFTTKARICILISGIYKVPPRFIGYTWTKCQLLIGINMNKHKLIFNSLCRKFYTRESVPQCRLQIALLGLTAQWLE